MGKVIDVEFRPSDRGRWCVRCDEPFPEGTAMCPRCGGDLSSAARHRAEVQTRARKKARRIVATGAGLLLTLIAMVVWLIIGGRVAHGQEKPPATEKPAEAAPAPTTPPPKPKSEKRKATDKNARPPEAGAPLGEDAVVSTVSPRPVRVKLLDGSTVVGTVHAEEPSTLVIDCSLGQLAIPRNRIATIAYDSAAGVGKNRAPVQQLDDEDKPTKKRAAQP